MKKLIFFTSLAFTSLSFSQEVEIHKCLSHEAIKYQDDITPGYADLVNEQFEITKNTPLKKTDEVYTIPVVFHVVYNTEEQNIADSVILNQLEVLNQDYSRQNADTINMRTDFDDVKGYPNIAFRLATIDPDGNPTTGITRTETNKESFADFTIINGFDVLEQVKQTDAGGIDPWNQERYLNIWICNMSIAGQTFLLGYATPPIGLDNWPVGQTDGLNDGVVVQYQTVGSNNPNPLDMGQGPLDVKGRTLTHEVGHYLGLRHIWGDGDCLEQDGIDDTPNANDQSDFDCNETKNTCEDDIFGVDLPDMIENYMDYSAESCQNSFTQGQVVHMRTVLENERDGLINDNPASVYENNQVAVNVYPNPLNEVLNISVAQGEIGTYELLTLNGAKVLEGSIEQQHTILHLSSLDKGIYMLKLVSVDHNSVLTKKVVKL